MHKIILYNHGKNKEYDLIDSEKSRLVQYKMGLGPGEITLRQKELFRIFWFGQHKKRSTNTNRTDKSGTNIYSNVYISFTSENKTSLLSYSRFTLFWVSKVSKFMEI